MHVQRLGLAMVGLLGLTACSSAKFSSQKSEVLAKNSVFEGDSSSGSLRQPGSDDDDDGDDSSGRLRQPSSDKELIGALIGGKDKKSKDSESMPTPVTEIGIKFICSDRQSESKQNFKGAIAQGLPLKITIGQSICTQNSNEIKSLVMKKMFTVADAQRLCPTLISPDGKISNFAIEVGTNKQSARSNMMSLLYARNEATDPESEAADSYCDQRSSPLVIHLKQKTDVPKPIALSSQKDGIFFDLLGSLLNHIKVKISWFTNEEYAFLALPNEMGQVASIDQLFGNATRGPDGRFADHGYDALAKYDGTSINGGTRVAAADNKIDRNDPIYSRLRLWVDKNRDGVSQANELQSLAKAGIKSIDLEYSNDYAETDQYGNETKMKSVVEYNDGSMDLIFDLWFAFEI